MGKDILVNLMKDIVKHLVDKDYAWVSANDNMRLLTEEEIGTGVEDHPGTLTMPPDSAFEEMYVFGTTDMWKRVDMHLWYDGKKGDMAIMCKIMDQDGKLTFGIEDVLVP